MNLSGPFIKRFAPLLSILILILKLSSLTICSPSRSHKAPSKRSPSERYDENYKQGDKNLKHISIRDENFDNRFGIQQNATKMNGVYIGFVVEGKGESMKEIMKELHVEPATYGKYTQVSPGETYNGNWQIGAVLEDVIQSGAVFQPAIMTKTNAGFTWNDNHQAVAVARALRKFTDANVTVWARFQHEVNWYVRDGTYVMSKKEYKEAWKVFAKAIKDIAPKVKLFWTPNVASGKNAMDEYKEWEPEDFDEVVDIVGIDWYPKTQSEATKDNFVKIMKDFHDKYASDRRPFALAEAGLHYEASHDMRVNWLDHMTQAKKELPHFLSLTWYNCKKEWDYKLVGHGLNTYKLRQKLT